MDKMYPPIVYFVSDKYLNVLRASLHFLRKYWLGKTMPRVVIAGYTKPRWELPEFAEFWSIGDFSDYPAKRWSDGIIRFLDFGPLNADDQMIIMLEDYLVLRDIDTSGISLLSQYMRTKPDLLRLDLSTDRLYCKTAREIGCIGRFDLIETKAPADYQCSLQPAIWDRAKLRQLLLAGESPWEFELNGTYRANMNSWSAIGTRQAPIRVKIAVNKGILDLDTNWQYPHALMHQSDRRTAEEICLTS